MRNVRALTGTAFLVGAIALVLPNSAGADTLFAVGEKYSSFENDRNAEQGSQFFTPVALSTGSEDGFFGGISTGYLVSTYRSPQPGAKEVTVSTLLDTKVSLYYTASLARGCVRVGSTFNLPTGKSALDKDERGAEIDREYGELADVSNFGEGTNANPGFAVTLPLDTFTIGLGGSFHVKGAYDPSTDVENDSVDPGDEVLGKFTLRWSGTDARIVAGIKYQYVGADKIDGDVVFKEGNMLSANANLEFTPKPWLFYLEGAYNNWEQGRNLSGTGNLPVEEFARYGDDLHVKATVQYLATPALVLIVEGNGHWAQGNRFPHDSELYDSGRTSLEAEVGFVYQIFVGFYLSGSVSYLQVKEDADANLAEDTTYSAFKSSLHLATFFK
jgi:hypothetical protein